MSGMTDDLVLWHDPESDAYTVRSGGEKEEVGPLAVAMIKELLYRNEALDGMLQFARLMLSLTEDGRGQDGM